VTILGHVDHGKTSLLDAIRSTEITADEAGGITQHIGAYTVHTSQGLEVTFIDTPGHEAFTAMRARGAQVTDVAVIVVAADDGVMPQTIEAINHAKAAEVAIVVAMNKIDKEGADPDKVLRELADQGLLAEDWGGDVGVVRTSATTGEGIEDLLDRLTLESEILELTANHAAKASGVVIEANLHEGRGVTTTLLVERGTLFAGDVVLAGSGYGRVRNLVNWKGEPVDCAGPSHAAEIMGLSEMPTAGGRFHVVENLKLAASAADQRAHTEREKELASRNATTSLATLFKDIAESKKSELRLIVKADAAGSLEVLRKTIADLENEEVKVNMIHSGVGAISTGDVTLAEASKAVIIGFHVTADGKARRQAEDRNISIQSYTIIYELLDDVRRGLEGLLAPDEVEKVIGHAEILQTFKSSKWGVIAGLQVSDGIVTRGCGLRVTRDGVIIHTGKVNTLRRFKEDVKEVKTGFECGLTVEKFNDIQPTDIFEFFTKVQVARTLS
jgi:translation initiation factor IF-2